MMISKVQTGIMSNSSPLQLTSPWHYLLASMAGQKKGIGQVPSTRPHSLYFGIFLSFLKMKMGPSTILLVKLYNLHTLDTLLSVESALSYWTHTLHLQRLDHHSVTRNSDLWAVHSDLLDRDVKIPDMSMSENLFHICLLSKRIIYDAPNCWLSMVSYMYYCVSLVSTIEIKYSIIRRSEI